MNTEDKINIMHAYSEGIEVEYRTKPDGFWRSLEECSVFEEPTWNWGTYDYRIKSMVKVPRDDSDTIRAIGVMTAYVLGAEVEVNCFGSGWVDVKFPSWNWDTNNYRIKQ